MKSKFLSILAGMSIVISTFTPHISTVFASSKITLQEYRYDVVSGWNDFGEIYCPGTKLNNKTYLEVQNNDFVALMDTETGTLSTPYVNWFQPFGEYSNLIVLGANDSTAILYDLEKSKEICTFIEKNGLMYGGHFSPNGGFIYLAEDEKLHFVSNEGVIGNAININQDIYKTDTQHLITWSYLGEGLYQLGVGNSYGLNKTIGIVNEDGEVIAYVDSIDCFNNGIAIASKNGNYGLINTAGEIVLDYKYERIDLVYNPEQYSARKDGVYYSINTSGSIVDIFTPDYTLYDGVDKYLGNGIAIVYKQGEFFRNKYGVIGKGNSFIVPIDYASISTDGFCENVCSFNLYTEYFNYESSLSTVIDSTGSCIINIGTYKSISTFSYGMAACKNTDGKYGYINKYGETIIPFNFDSAEAFSEGLAAICIDKYGYINTEGEVVIPCIYTYAESFKDGIAYVGTENGTTKIDKSGNAVSLATPSKYTLTEAVEKGKPYTGGIKINSTGEIIDISGLGLLPVILGENGDTIIAFSSDLSKAYKIVITEDTSYYVSKAKTSKNECIFSFNIETSAVTKGTVIVSVYDDKNKLLGLNIQNAEFSNGYYEATDLPVEITGTPYRYKIMLWSNTDTLNQVASPYDMKF